MEISISLGEVSSSVGEKDELWDLVIIGGGPAGITAGIYGERAGLKTIIIEKLAVGGQAVNTYHIENYPGFPDGISGQELMDRFRKQCEKFGTKIVYDEIHRIEKGGDIFSVQGMEASYKGKAIIVATGAEPKKLDIPGEKEYTGRGVSYCAVCDGAFFKDKLVTVIGGGDAALEEAEYLTKFAKKVYIVHRRDEFRAQKIIQNRVLKNEKIQPVLNKVPISIKGDTFVKAIELKDTKTGEISELEVDGIFVYVGVLPMTSFLPKNVLYDDGTILINEKLMTPIEGMFAAGDCVKDAPKQVITAAADGAKAALFAYEYITSKGL